MKWKVIKEDGDRVIIWCPGRMNSGGDHNIFKQGNDQCHKSRLISDFMDKLKIYRISDWTPQSPDLNIPAVLWFELKVSIAKCRSANIE